MSDAVLMGADGASDCQECVGVEILSMRNDGRICCCVRRRCPTPPDHEQAYGVPSLADLGLEVQLEVLWPGGETHALQRLHKHFQSQV